MLKAHMPKQVLVCLSVTAWLEELLVKTEDTWWTPSNALRQGLWALCESQYKLDTSVYLDFPELCFV